MEETTPSLELTVSVQPYNQKNGQLMDAIASSSKLTKADAGRAAGASADEDWLNVTVEASEANPDIIIPKVSVNYHRKVSFIADSTAG